MIRTFQLNFLLAKICNMGKVKKIQESKRKDVALLINAHKTNAEVAQITGVSIRTVQRVRRKLEAGYDVKDPSRPSKTKKLTPAFLDNLNSQFEADPYQSIRQVARSLKVDEKTIRNGLKILGKKSKRRPHRQLLTPKMKQSRVTKGSKLVSSIKKLPRGTVRIFSDKKLFTVDMAYNPRTCRMVVSREVEATPVMRHKHPASVMMLGVVGSDGKKMPPYFFKSGLKINTEVYLNVMRRVVKPWIEATYPDGNYIWQQDSAPAHGSNKTQKWLADNLASYWPKELWPPNSPDANPLDYAIWGEMTKRVGGTSYNSTDDLKAAILREWDDLPEAYVRKSCRSFRRRLEDIVAADGGHIEGKRKKKK